MKRPRLRRKNSSGAVLVFAALRIMYSNVQAADNIVIQPATGVVPMIELRLPNTSTPGVTISYQPAVAAGAPNTALFQLPRNQDVWKWQSWDQGTPGASRLQMSLYPDNSLELVNTAGYSKIVLKPGTLAIAPEITINGAPVLTQTAADARYIFSTSNGDIELKGTVPQMIRMKDSGGGNGQNLTLQAGAGVGANAAGGDLYLAAGLAKGSGGGNIFFKTPGVASNADEVAPMITRMAIYGNGAIAIGTGAQVGVGDNLAIGEHATTSQWEGIALGKYATASGETALALGAYTLATQKNAVSIGIGNIALAANSFAAGYQTISQGQGQTVVGSFSAPVGNPNDKDDPQSEVFVVGGGRQDYTTFQITRKNVFTVKRNGDAEIGGSLKVNGVIRVEPAGDIDMGEFEAPPQP